MKYKKFYIAVHFLFYIQYFQNIKLKVKLSKQIVF